jgi:hypothetical protein
MFPEFEEKIEERKLVELLKNVEKNRWRMSNLYLFKKQYEVNN